jgi:hypothetical protein
VYNYDRVFLIAVFYHSKVGRAAIDGRQTSIAGVASTTPIITICLVGGYMINDDQEGQQ